MGHVGQMLLPSQAVMSAVLPGGGIVPAVAWKMAGDPAEIVTDGCSGVSSGLSLVSVTVNPPLASCATFSLTTAPLCSWRSIGASERARAFRGADFTSGPAADRETVQLVV